MYSITIIALLVIGNVVDASYLGARPPCVKSINNYTRLCHIILVILLAATFFVKFYIGGLHSPWVLEKADSLTGKWREPCDSLVNVTSLYDLSRFLSSSSCPRFRSLLTSMFEINSFVTELAIPPSMARLYASWLRVDAASAVASASRQRIVRVRNKWTGAVASYNALRGMRPGTKKESDGGEASAISSLAKASATRCPFCGYRTDTAGNAFFARDGGHVVVNDGGEGGDEKWIFEAASSGNAFPASRFHGIVFAAQHSILRLDLHDFRHMTAAAMSWFKEADAAASRAAANEVRADAADAASPTSGRLRRVMYMDSSPSAGASQVHPHMQTFVFTDAWPEKWRKVVDAADEYESTTKRNYFSDFVHVHRGLGLGSEVAEGIYTFAHLSPVKNGEIFVIDIRSSSTSSFFDAIFQVIEMHRSKETFSFTLGVALRLRSDKKNVNEVDAPSIARILPRNPVGSPNSEFSSFDLFLHSVISKDPFDLVKNLQTIKRHRRTVG